MAKVKKFINNSRTGSGPGFLECITYRWYGHVDWRDDIDVGVKRSLEDVDNWKARDPISRLSLAMIDSGIWSVDEQLSFESNLDLSINDAWEKAMNDPFPNESSIMKNVYSDST